MRQHNLERLSTHLQTLRQIQEEVEQILAEEQASKAKLQKKTEAYAQSELVCDSLEYVVDDLDSVLGNLEDLLSD